MPTEGSPTPERAFTASTVARLSGLAVEVPYASDAFLVTRWRCCEPARGPSPVKRQPWYALGFVEGGSFRMRSGRGTSVVDSTAILLLRPDEDYQTTHESHCGDYGNAIAFSPHTARILELECRRQGGGDPWRVQTRPAEARLLARKLDLLRQMEPEAAALRRMAIEESLIELTFKMLVPAPLPHSRQGERSASERVKAVQELLERRFTEPLRLDEIARAVESTPFYLCRQFRRHTGWTIHRYLTHLRVAHALERLASAPHTRLIDLALELGFDGHSHFSAVFRRWVGRSPSAFRGAVARR